MKRMLRTAVAVELAALLLAIAAPSVASAATEAYLDGSPQSNACFGYASSDSGPVAFRQPFDDVGPDAIFPPVALRLVYVADFNLMATTAWMPGVRTPQDIIQP